MGVWQCLCFAILLLPDLDAASVKLVHTGTETFEKDGVKHERSRYRLVPDHENNEPVDKAIRSIPNDEHDTDLTTDKHAKKVAIKVLPNDGYKHGLKADERTNKVALTILPNEAQDKLTRHYSTKTQPQIGATHKTTYHYSIKTQPKVTDWSSGRKVNSSAKNLWNKDPSKVLYSYPTRRHGDDQDHQLSHNKKFKKLLFSKEFLELLNTLNLSKSGQNHLTAEEKLQLRLLLKTFMEKLYKSNSKDHHEISEDDVRRDGHDDLQWELTTKALLGQLLSKMHSLNEQAPQESEDRGLTDNEIIQRNLYSLNTQGEQENHGNDHEKLRQKLNSLNTQAGYQNHEHDYEKLRQNHYSLNTQGEHTIYGNDQKKLQQDRITLHSHENKKDLDLANQEENRQGLVLKQNLTKHLLVNGASRPKTLDLGHIARLETGTPVNNDTHKNIIDSNVQTEILPNQTSKQTETEHRPIEVTVKDSEKPVQFNHSHLLRYLISSVGLNKTFVMPGESGRYKLVHEGDEEAAINLALIHWLKSQKKYIPSIDKRIMADGDGHFVDELKVLPLHHAETKHKMHTPNAQTVPDIDTHIPVGIYHHDVNEILPEMTTGLDSITESIIHIDEELGTITSTTEKNYVSSELKMVVDASEATASDNTLNTTDDILSSTDNTLTTSGNADNESDNITSATENPEVSTTENINKSKLLNDPSMLELLSSYGLDMNDIVYEPEINMAIPSLTDQRVTIMDRTTTEEKAANIHGLDITSTPEGHDVSTTKTIDISKSENKPPLLEFLSSYGLDMHDINDEPEKHFAISSLNAHSDTIQNPTTTEAIETGYDGGGVTSTTVNHEVSTTEVINISKFANDPSLLELLSSYGLGMHDVFNEPEIQNVYPFLAVQPDEALEANSEGIDRSSTNENPEVSTTKVIDISELENEPSLLELLTSYGLKMDDIVGKPEEHIEITSPTAPPDTIVDRTTTKATDVNNDGVDISKTTDSHEILTTKVKDIPNLKYNSSLLDLPTSYGLATHDIIDYTEKYMAMPSLTDDTIRELLETKATKEKEAKKDRVDFTSVPKTNKESTTEDIEMSKVLNDPSLLDLLASYGLKMHDKVDEPDVTTANPLLTALGDDRKATEPNTSKGVVSTEKYATVIPQQDLDDIIYYYTHAAEHSPETDYYEDTSEGGKPLVVLDEINNDKDDNDDLKNNLLGMLEHETKLANLLELEQVITTNNPLSEYENLLTEPIDNHTSSLPDPYNNNDDDLKYIMDNLQHEQNYHKNLENVNANDLVYSQKTIQEPDQPKNLNQTWPPSWHANKIPTSSRIIYREEIRHSGNYNNHNINVHNNLNLVKQSDNAHLNAVAPDDVSHYALTYLNKDANHESLQDTNNYVNEHYLEIVLGYLNSDILTNELNALMAYSGPGQDRDQVILQFVVGYLNKLGIKHHISQEQLQYLTHKVLKHLLNYNKQYKVRKIELIYEFDHPHDLSSNANMLSKNVRGQFLSYPHNMHIQEHVPNVLPDDHLVPNFHHELQQNNIDIRDHNLHNLALHPYMGDVSDQTHLLWYNQNPDLDTLSDLNAHPHIDENTNQEYKVSDSDLHYSPDIAPHQNQDAQISDNISKGVFIEQRNLFPYSDQEGLNQNEHNSNYDYNNSDNHFDDSDRLNLALADFIHHQQSDQLAPNDNVDQNEPNLSSDPHLFHSDNSNLAPEQDNNHQNDNLAPNLNADLNEKELNLKRDDFNTDHTDSDYWNLLSEHYGYHQPNDNLSPNHNFDQSEHILNSDYHFFDSEYSNLASEHQQQNDHLVPNQIADLKEHELDFHQNNPNNNHDADFDNFLPNLDSVHHHPNNHHIDFDYLNFVPDHHGHHQQKNHLAPNYNVDYNEHTLGLEHQNTDDHPADPDHSNLGLGHDSYHIQNIHLANNHNPIFYAQNSNFDDHHPYQHLVDSDLLNSVPGHHQQYYYDLAQNHGSHSNQPSLDSNQYHSNTQWGAQPEQDFVPKPNVYSSPNQQIWPLETEQPNLVYEPHFPTFDHQQNEHFFPSLPHHQIEPWSSKEKDNLPHQGGVDELSPYYALPYQQFDYIESSIYPQPDKFGQWTGSDYHNQPNAYPFYSYQQNGWYSSHQALSPKQQTHGLAPPNIDLSSPYQPYSDQNVYLDQRSNLPVANQHNGYEVLGILDGTHLMEYLTDGIDLPNHGVVSSLNTKVHSLVSYLLDHDVSESIVLEFVDDVKKQLAEEFLERLRECQNKAYSILVQSISNLAQVYLQKHR